MCILELSKVLMYEFHYNYIKINMTENQNFYLQTLIVQCMKKQMVSTNILVAKKKDCLMLVIILLSKNTMIIETI